MIFLRNRDGYGADGRRLLFLDFGDDDGGSPAPTDYTPVANASKEAAQIMADQADRVLTESTRQYDRNMEVAKPVIDTQLAMMKQAKDQGDEYFSHWQGNAKPVEVALAEDAMAEGSEARQEEAVGRAVADVRAGTTQQQNQFLRQAGRYGFSKDALTKLGGSNALQAASGIASAATLARDKSKALGTAKKLDVAGLGRGMPGASQGAYSVANNSGNSAVNNSTNVGAGMTQGTIAAGGLVGQGQQMRLSGLTGIMNAQNSYNLGVMNQNNQSSAGLGQMLGTIGGLAGKMLFA